MELCDKTITVFNAKYDADFDHDVYIGTIINGASWFETLKSNVDSNGLSSAKVVTVRIPVNADFSGKSFVDFIAYKGADPSSVFTLHEGDIIVKGGVSMENAKPAALQSMFPDMFTIVSVTDSTHAPNAPHWKVVGA